MGFFRQGLFGISVGLLWALPGFAAVQGDLRPILRATLAAYAPAAEVASAVERERQSLLGFYDARGFAPIWLAENAPALRAERLLALLKAADRHGLSAVDYNVAEIALLLQAADAQTLARLEFALSQAALRYAADMLGARAASVDLPADVKIVPRPLDAERILRELARSDDPAGPLEALAPADPAYAQLRDWLAAYRAFKAGGGWRNIASGPTLDPGTNDPRVPALRRRLAITDGAPAEPADAEAADLFDIQLVAALMRFQARHGLAADGRLGRRTLAALNRSVDARIAQIVANLDRMRARPANEASFIEVNVPGFALRAVEAGETRIEMPVVVGREARATPIFSSRVTEVIFNPSWTVPAKLVREDLLPRLRANPQAMVDLGFRFYRGSGDERVEVDPRKVDWRKVSPRAMPYWVRQDPGPKNALGQVRLTLPNIYDVFLHDTPDRQYFARAERALSSGCVRLERPIDLAEWVLRNTPGWTREAIEAADADAVTRNVPVRRPIPLHFVYFTAFVQDGELHLREDIYGVDARFVAGIERRPVADLRLPREGAAPPASLAP
jgi:murein L,D-transpeptidase YcbB/YkuD